MMKLSQAAKLLQGQLIGDDIEFGGISTDTRTLHPGDLFIALQGPNFDGHDFITAAVSKQAAAVMTHKAVTSALSTLQVADTLNALGQLAAYHRQQFTLPIIGITGSCGKTTTRALTASILTAYGNTLFSESSYNNAIGVPLTLMRLRPEHQYAVIEMGANHFGEIAYLTHLAKPTVALITNAAAAHLEGFGSIDGVCKAKGEIFQGLPATGIGILNADDPHCADWEKILIGIGKRVLHFSLTKPVDVYAKHIHINAEGKPRFTLFTPLGETRIQLPLLGQHNVANALAAATVAYAVNAPLTAIKAGLENATAVKKRLNIHRIANGVQIIDDSYNANPLSVQAAITTLAQYPGEKILVLGDMRELGENAEVYHQAIGTAAQHAGINRLYTYGNFSAAATTAFGAQAQHFTNQDALIAALKTQLSPSTTVLVKGSLSMGMSRVVEALLATAVV